MTLNSVDFYGPYSVVDTGDANEIIAVLEALTYTATAKWLTIGPNPQNQFWIVRIDTA